MAKKKRLAKQVNPSYSPLPFAYPELRFAGLGGSNRWACAEFPLSPRAEFLWRGGGEGVGDDRGSIAENEDEVGVGWWGHPVAVSGTAGTPALRHYPPRELLSERLPEGSNGASDHQHDSPGVFDHLATRFEDRVLEPLQVPAAAAGRLALFAEHRGQVVRSE